MPGRRAQYILMVGNPGTGKSTLLNSLCGRIKFQAGASCGAGLTYNMQKEHWVGDTFLLDTPGLTDVEMRRKAAEEITKALKQDGNYKVFFVMTLESGRLRPEDLVTMKLILQAADIGEYGVIINKVTRPIMRKLRADAGVLLDALFRDMPRTTNHVTYVEEVSELRDQDNAIWQMPEHLHSFIVDFPGVVIDSRGVRGVDAEDFDARLADRGRVLAEILSEDRRKAKEIQELKRSQAQQARETAEAKARVEELERQRQQQAAAAAAAARAAQEAQWAAEQRRQQLEAQARWQREEQERRSAELRRELERERARREERERQEARRREEERQERERQSALSAGGMMVMTPHGPAIVGLGGPFGGGFGGPFGSPFGGRIVFGGHFGGPFG